MLLAPQSLCAQHEAQCEVGKRCSDIVLWCVVVLGGHGAPGKRSGLFIQTENIQAGADDFRKKHAATEWTIPPHLGFLGHSGNTAPESAAGISASQNAGWNNGVLGEPRAKTIWLKPFLSTQIGPEAWDFASVSWFRGFKTQWASVSAEGLIENTDCCAHSQSFWFNRSHVGPKIYISNKFPIILIIWSFENYWFGVMLLNPGCIWELPGHLKVPVHKPQRLIKTKSRGGCVGGECWSFCSCCCYYLLSDYWW